VADLLDFAVTKVSGSTWKATGRVVESFDQSIVVADYTAGVNFSVPTIGTASDVTDLATLLGQELLVQRAGR
jgi:hypothetical protein